jgi:hypothetical protein
MLPSLTHEGDLPAGVHSATLSDLAQRFGTGSVARSRALFRLSHVHELAQRTGKLQHFYVFGSFVSAAPEPRDIDVALVMSADFRLADAPRECRTLFSHADAQARYGASIFWVRAGMLSDAALADFLDAWQTKRDGRRRGIVEIA